jgi:hypothetical protein
MGQVVNLQDHRLVNTDRSGKRNQKPRQPDGRSIGRVEVRMNSEVDEGPLNLLGRD